MGDGPPQVSIDTAELKEIGQFHLPDLAVLHYNAAVAMDGVPFGDGLFRAAGAESDAKSPAYQPWCELFSLVQGIIGNTSTIYADTAEAVTTAADDYRDQELSNAEAIAANNQFDDYVNGTGGEPGYGPPTELPPDPPAPRDTPDDVYVDRPDEGDFVDRGSDEE